MTYTVTFKHRDSGNWEVSRYCVTARIARNWERWLRNQKWVRETAIYRGPAGGERIS